MTLLYKTVKLLILISLFGLQMTAFAEPYLAVKNNMNCAACHVNPNGGGLRNALGRMYGQNLLPVKPSSFNTVELAELSKFFAIGANARFNAKIQKTEQTENNTSRSFEVASAQVYLNIKIPETGLSFYLDQQVAPGSAINREAFVMYQFDDSDFVKAGKLFLPYGLRIEDDYAFIRQATGMNFDNCDNGVEYGLNYDSTNINLYVANGTSQASNDDDSFLYGMALNIGSRPFASAPVLFLMMAISKPVCLIFMVAYTWGDITFLTEVDYINIQTSPASGQQKRG
jgi:hypothetical protein